MIHDPEFGYDQESKRPVGRRRRWWRRLLLYPLLCLSGCHMLMTGSPVPLWSIEYLDHPVKVTSVGDDGLHLADGRLVRLPSIMRVPSGIRSFREALRSGVEVKPDGEVVGLVQVKRMCGNDPYAWVTRRVNLSDLAGGLDPDTIDDAIVPRDWIEELKQSEYSTADSPPGSYVVRCNARKVHDLREACASRPDPNPVYVIELDRHPAAPAGAR
jgi:hypothetical protein